MELPKDKQTDFIAQEIETLFPDSNRDTVSSTQYNENEILEDFNTTKIQQQLEALKIEGKNLKQEIEKIKSLLNNLTNK